MSIWDVPGDIANEGGELLSKGYEAIPGVKSLPGFGDNPGLLTEQKSGNLLISKASVLRSKSHLNQREIAELWIYEGGDNATADLASAVAMAESGGRAKVNSNPCCKGLYQLNVSVGVSTFKCAMNAGCATKYTIGLSKNGTAWSPWESYTNGKYKKFLGKSGITASSSHTTLGDAANSVGNALNPFADLVRFIGRLFEPSFWLRVGKGLLGFLLLLFGALTLMKVLINVEIPTGPVNRALRSSIAGAAGS